MYHVRSGNRIYPDTDRGAIAGHLTLLGQGHALDHILGARGRREPGAITQ